MNYDAAKKALMEADVTDDMLMKMDDLDRIVLEFNGMTYVIDGDGVFTFLSGCVQEGLHEYLEICKQRVKDNLTPVSKDEG